MPPKIEMLPGIRRVALEIAYDNGFVGRGRTEEEWLASLDEVLGAEGVDEDDLVALDEWCRTLTDEEAQTLAAGEESEMQAIAARCPRPELCGLFEDIFNHG